MLRKIKIKLRKTIELHPFLMDQYESLADIKYSILSFIPDKYYIPLLYRSKTGRKINIENPTTLSDKVNWLKLNYRSNSLITEVSDKIEMRSYVKELDLDRYLVPIEQVASSFEELDFYRLQEGEIYYIKTNHDSGTVKKYKHEGSTPINYRKYFTRNLGKNYYKYSREWNYKDIIPKIFIEKNINVNNFLQEYKFFCIHGEPEFCFVYDDAMTSKGVKKTNPNKKIVDSKKRTLPFQMGKQNSDRVEIKISNEEWDKLLNISRKLSRPFPFVRVDFLYNGVDFYIGELTFFSGGGNFTIFPTWYDEYYGSKLSLECINEESSNGEISSKS